jgi:hypothetical protein
MPLGSQDTASSIAGVPTSQRASQLLRGFVIDNQ